MNKESEKDLVEASVTTTLALSGGPIAAAVAVAPLMISSAWQALQSRRANKWWDGVCRADEAGDLQAKIRTGLLEDSEYVIAGVVEGARAACAAVDMAAVPIIAELSRRFISAEDIPRWFYRGSLELFERVNAEDIRVLRVLFGEIESITTPKVTLSARDPAQNRAFPSDGDPRNGIPITPIADPERIFSLIKRVGLGFESDGWGMSGAANAVVIKRDVIGWLRSALVDA